MKDTQEVFQALADGKNFEMRGDTFENWHAATHNSVLNLLLNGQSTARLRIAKATIQIGDMPLNAPLTAEPKMNEVYWIPLPYGTMHLKCVWMNELSDQTMLTRRRAFGSAEDAAAFAKACILLAGGTV